MSTQYVLQVDDKTFKVERAWIRKGSKAISEEWGFAEFDKSVEHPSGPPRDEPNVALRVVRTGTGSCSWVPTSTGWKYICTP